MADQDNDKRRTRGLQTLESLLGTPEPTRSAEQL